MTKSLKNDPLKWDTIEAIENVWVAVKLTEIDSDCKILTIGSRKKVKNYLFDYITHHHFYPLPIGCKTYENGYRIIHGFEENFRDFGPNPLEVKIYFYPIRINVPIRKLEEKQNG